VYFTLGIGIPHFGQVTALSLISFPHSLQGIKAIIALFRFVITKMVQKEFNRTGLSCPYKKTILKKGS